MIQLNVTCVQIFSVAISAHMGRIDRKRRLPNSGLPLPLPPFRRAYLVVPQTNTCVRDRFVLVRPISVRSYTLDEQCKMQHDDFIFHATKRDNSIRETSHFKPTPSHRGCERNTYCGSRVRFITVHIIHHIAVQ